VAQIVSFINYKGGVGKTTIAVETAATLAKQYGFKVLVVDLDPQTNASFYLLSSEQQWESWADTRGSLKDIFQSAVNDQDFDAGSVIMENLHDCIDLLPSHLDLLPVDLELAAKWGAQSSEAKMIIKDKLGPVIQERGYDFVVIDCPPNLNLVTQNALMLSDSYVVVCLPEYFSVRGIGLIETQISKMMEQINNNLIRFGVDPVPGPLMKGIIFNRIRYVSGGTIAQQNWMNLVRRTYPAVTFQNFVAETVRVAEASHSGPITFSHRSGDQPYVRQLLNVGQEFFDKVVEAPGVSK
jgi:chromosome partitioning protein